MSSIAVLVPARAPSCSGSHALLPPSPPLTSAPPAESLSIPISYVAPLHAVSTTQSSSTRDSQRWQTSSCRHSRSRHFHHDRVAASFPDSSMQSNSTVKIHCLFVENGMMTTGRSTSDVSTDLPPASSSTIFALSRSISMSSESLRPGAVFAIANSNTKKSPTSSSSSLPSSTVDCGRPSAWSWLRSQPGGKGVPPIDELLATMGSSRTRRAFVLAGSSAVNSASRRLVQQDVVPPEDKEELLPNELRDFSSSMESPEEKQVASPQSSLTRRVAVVMLAAGLAMPRGSVAVAAESYQMSEDSTPGMSSQILKGLGLTGDSDIYYPRIFEGTWDCYSTLLSVDTPQGEEVTDLASISYAKKQLGYTVAYQARFIPYENHIIGDRLFTTTSLTESSIGKGAVIDGDWSPENASQLTLTVKGGVKVEAQITKRSFAMSASGQFDTSEFSRQVFDSSSIREGPPSIKASQNLTRYKWDPTLEEVNQIEAFQRVSMYAIPGQQVASNPSGLSTLDVIAMGGKPTTVYKYLVRLRRPTTNKLNS